MVLPRSLSLEGERWVTKCQPVRENTTKYQYFMTAALNPEVGCSNFSPRGSRIPESTEPTPPPSSRRKGYLVGSDPTAAGAADPSENRPEVLSS